jgi:hypothetical protein
MPSAMALAAPSWSEASAASVCELFSVRVHRTIFGQPTQNNIGFGSLLLYELRIVIATKHNTNVRVGLLDDVCFVLGADKCRVFVVGVLLVEGIESVSSNVSGNTSAFELVSRQFLLLVCNLNLQEDFGCHVCF